MTPPDTAPCTNPLGHQTGACGCPPWPHYQPPPHAPCPADVLAAAREVVVKHQMRTHSMAGFVGSTLVNEAKCTCGVKFTWGRRSQDHEDHWLQVIADEVWRAAHAR